jgi:hypothetical protein
LENRSGGQAGVVCGGRFRTSRRIVVLPFTVRALTANGKTVVDASESRAKIVFVALAVRAPARSGTRRTLAGVGKAESMEFHGRCKGHCSGSRLPITKRGTVAAPGLEVELESVEGRMGRCHCCAWAEQIRWFTLRNLLRLGRRSGRRQEFTHLLLEKIGQFAATPDRGPRRSKFL